MISDPEYETNVYIKKQDSILRHCYIENCEVNYDVKLAFI